MLEMLLVYVLFLPNEYNLQTIDSKILELEEELTLLKKQRKQVETYYPNEIVDYMLK